MYDYKNAVRNDVREWIDVHYSEDEIKEKLARRDEWEQELYDELFTEDSVTGNGSGSYTFNREEAGKCLAGNFDELADAITEFGSDFEDIIREGEEACDVTIRCYYLGDAISSVLDDLADEYLDEQE